MKIYKKAILPLGFMASGVSAGIKKSKKLDLGLIFSKIPCKAGALFATNRLFAAPIEVSKRYLKNSKIFHGVIVNSGNANSFTGRQGLKDAHKMSKIVAEILGVRPKSILVASTGVIGKRLVIHKIIEAIPFLVKWLSKKGIKEFAQAILTTDRFTKEIAVKINIASKEITICGVAKGAGMIFPNMATMLCFITSDINIERNCLAGALKNSVEDSFNSISVDGCQSTNDMALILANAGAGNNILTRKSPDYLKFFNALKYVCRELAKMIVKDGEGATKLIQIDVTAARTKSEAKRVGFAIANSNLFKTAMYGSSPNLGRVVQSVGASGIDIKEKDLKIKFGNLKGKEVKIKVNLNRGRHKATVYTSDLTPEYIRINARYN